MAHGDDLRECFKCIVTQTPLHRQLTGHCTVPSCVSDSGARSTETSNRFQAVLFGFRSALSLKTCDAAGIHVHQADRSLFVLVPRVLDNR